jgi:Short C-terminal domain
VESRHCPGSSLPRRACVIMLVAGDDMVPVAPELVRKRQNAAFTQAVQQAAGTTSTADEFARLADLKANGTITDAEFEQAKAKALSS